MVSLFFTKLISFVDFDLCSVSTTDTQLTDLFILTSGVKLMLNRFLNSSFTALRSSTRLLYNYSTSLKTSTFGSSLCARLNPFGFVTDLFCGDGCCEICVKSISKFKLTGAFMPSSACGIIIFSADFSCRSLRTSSSCLVRLRNGIGSTCESN